MPPDYAYERRIIDTFGPTTLVIFSILVHNYENCRYRSKISIFFHTFGENMVKTHWI